MINQDTEPDNLLSHDNRNSELEQSLRHILLLSMGVRLFFIVIGAAFLLDEAIKVLLQGENVSAKMLLDIGVVSFLFPVIVWVSAKWGERFAKEATRSHSELALLSDKAQREVAERRNVESALRLSEEVSNRIAREYALLADIGRIVSSSLDMNQVYERFAERLHGYIHFDRISINLLDHQQGIIRGTYSAGLNVPAHALGGIRPLQGSFAEEVVRSRSPLLVQGEDLVGFEERFPVTTPAIEAGLRSFLAVPLISNSKVIGCLNFASTSSNAYNQRDVDLAERIGIQIAGAVASSHLHTALQMEADDRALLAEVGRIISSTLDINDVYERFAVTVRGIIPFDRVTISIIEYDTSSLKIAYVSGVEVSERRHGEIVPLSGTVSEATIRQRRGLILQDTDEEVLALEYPGMMPSFRTGLKSLMAVPLFSKDSVIGVLQFRSSQNSAYSERHLELAESIGNQIAGAIANSLLHDKTHHEALERTALAEIGRIISSTLDINEVYPRFTDEVRKLIPLDRISINRIDPMSGTFIELYQSGIDVPSRRTGDMTPVSGSITSRVVEQRAGLLVQSSDPEELKAQFPGLTPAVEVGIRSALSVPLISRDEVIGILHIRSLEPYAFTELHLSMAERVGTQIAGAISNAQLYSDLKRTEQEREKLITDLQEAAGQIKTLSGMLPICASCKKVRDDTGYWSQIETYISERSDADFSHGICPDCFKTLYPGFHAVTERS